MDQCSSQDNFVLRAARPADWPGLEEMLHASWHDAYDSIMGSKKVDRILKSMSAQMSFLGPETVMSADTFLTAQFDDRPVGLLHVAPTLLSRQHFIWMLYVHPHFQGRGVGRALLDYACERLPGASAFRLAVLPANSRAIAFYKKNGFQRVRRSFDLWNWEQVVIMDRPGSVQSSVKAAQTT